tara:strand:+ start:885 stop:1706 length:822 start_codon:yes stop_codon:yes gene_type:complete
MNFLKMTDKNLKNYLIFILILVILFFIVRTNFSQNIKIKSKLVQQNFDNLVSVLGKPTFLEKDGENYMNSSIWMSPLDKFNDFGKFGGCDYIKISGHISKKYHPYPANVFLIVGKYINVPDNLLGPIKFASETINIEQLFVPLKYAEKYYETGVKDLALVTGSCASITISAITVQFVIDMINKYRNYDGDSLELYEIFRNEYDRRIDDYLCGKGITDPIDWFEPSYFNEGEKAYLGDDKCKKSVVEGFSHFPECEQLMSEQDFCKNNPEHKCC